MFEIAAAFLCMCEHTARKKPRGGGGAIREEVTDWSTRAGGMASVSEIEDAILHVFLT